MTRVSWPTFRGGAGLRRGLGWAALTGAVAVGAAPPLEDARRDFANPPAEYRILKIIHGWPDQPAAQDERIRLLQRQGLGGVVCNVAFGGGYLEDAAKWEAFLRGVREARKAGLAMWLYDEKGYPSGNAGGIVLREHPELEARGLLVAEVETAGEPVKLAVPPGRLVLAAAYAVSGGGLDLGRRVPLAAAAGETLAWTPPPGHWRVLAMTEDRLYEGTHAAHNVYAHIPYVNLLEPEATREFLRVTHQQYAARLEPNLGRWFMATFTDEPSLMSLFLAPMPYRPLPWSRGLAAEFRRRRGYDLEPWLPALVADCGGRERKARHDFWLTVGELVSANFFGAIQDWCAGHGLPAGGHLLFEENPLHQVASYGDFYRCIRRLDAPSIDVLTSLPPDVPVQIARLLASAAELAGKTLVMSETSDHAQRYRPAGDRRPVRIVSEDEIRGTFNRQLVGGVNCFTSYYSFADCSDDAVRRLNEWVGRCCRLLRGSRPAPDLAVVYPTESLWVRFVPSRHQAREAVAARRVADTYGATVTGLHAAACDYTIIDAQALAAAEPRDSFLAHGELRWRVVILPGVDTLPAAAWQTLVEFARQGGVVIALGARPENSESEFPSPQVRPWGRELFGAEEGQPVVRANSAGGGGIYLPLGSEGLLGRVLGQLIAEPSVRAVGGGAPVRATHRVVGEDDVYFVINDSPTPWSGAVALRAGAAAGDLGWHLWRPGTGAIAPVAAGREIPLTLGGYDAVLLTGRSARPPVCARLESGQLPGLPVRRLPAAAEPQVAGGEFVRGTLAPDAEHSGGAAGAWRVAGTVTKGGVDTHLFLRWAHAAPLDLSGAELLVLDTWVPEDGTTNENLLVILHEQGGGDFIADSGRPLSMPGYRRVFVPLERFRLAGWSQDADQRLDLARIGEIRIGWGGHLGQEGERIEFSVAAPLAVQRDDWAPSEPASR